MATPQVKDLVLHSPAGSSEVITFLWPLQVGTGQDKHDNGIDIIDTIKFVCDELPGISSAFEEINLNQIDTACYKTMTNLVDRFNKAVDSIVALEKGTSLPAERLNKFAHPSLLRHILQLVYNAAVLDPDKLNNYEPFSPEVYGETSYELVQQMIKHVNVTNDDTFIDLGSGVGQVVLQMAGSFPLRTCIGIEKADTPARYAERMDMYFRQFMAWFGKRYCEYKLIKGDFLVDEHREKITSSTLVFVNNFAFGPNVDHQLKERFADLRDGARVVSSKSFCPLNFRITDRNLSDIGTIMHVSEIPPLKGSVSWTCKPVSYYLHVIDRTILERYFQRLKTQKGAENDHVGSTRTTRDRAKREANNHALNNHNNNNHHQHHYTGVHSNSSSLSQRTNSPANVNSHAAASKTRQQQQQQLLLQQQEQQQQQQKQQQQLDLVDMDNTSTESDGDAPANGTGTSTTNGPTTRKFWSDWCSSKGKSSQSDDEDNNNFSSTTNSRNARAATQKKRKKLTRKAAVASKSAAAAQREAAAREREREREAANAVATSNSKESSSKEDGSGNAAGPGRGRKGRMKKGGPRGRKSLNIIGLEVLHKQTVLSTSVEVLGKKLPPAPGCVDQQLTSLLTRSMTHTELDIPETPANTPYALQILLDVFRTQYMAMMEQMRSKSFIPNIKRQIQLEQERKQRIKNRASQLDKQIKVLIDDSVALLKVRMNELGINVSSPNDLIAKAKEIVGRHKELQGIAKKIQSQVTACELEQKRLLKKHLQHIPEYQMLQGNSKLKLELPLTNGHDLSEAAAHELVLKEIANTLAQRKKLYAQVSCIEREAASLEKATEERRTAAVLLAQGTNMTLATSNAGMLSVNQPMKPATLTPAIVQPLQLTTNNNSSNNNAINAHSSVPNNATTTTTTTKSSGGTAHSKSSRRSRDHRTRSQEWPDVPDVGKIEESNPEVLAQKILETGRQIEAGKFTTNATNYASAGASKHNHPHLEEKRGGKHQRSSSNEQQLPPTMSVYIGPQDSSLMPAPPMSKHHAGLPPNAASISVSVSASVPNTVRGGAGSLLPKCELPGSRQAKSNASGIQESPKVANFEDRLKSIITSALNEDQEHRKAAAHQMPASASGSSMHEATPSPQQSPAPKRSKHHASSLPASAVALNAVPNAAAVGHHLLHQQHQQHLAPLSQAPNNLSNIITVATQGLTHLNATTTISPITPPLPPAAATAAIGGSQYGAPQYGGKYGFANKQQSATSSSSNSATSSSLSAQKYALNSAKDAPASSASAKYLHHGPPLPQQQQQHLVHMQQMQHALYGASNAAPSDLAFHHRRRSSISAASYEHFAAQQQQQQQQHQAMVMAAAVAAAAASQHHHGGAHHAHAAPGAAHQNLLSLEFKAPSAGAENLMAAAQRSSSREQLQLDEAPRSSSANSDSAVMYYPPTRERLMSLERSASRDSTVSQPLPPPQHQGGGSGPPQPSRPHSNSSQPDYTQVSPAKMALRRHLSQEKLNQQGPQTGAASGSGSGGMPMSSKTIGDLVNGEIERTLEISHQTIINAVVNMSTVGNERTSYMERGIFTERDKEREGRERELPNERLLINPNAQRPERVHVRVPEHENAASTNASHGSYNHQHLQQHTAAANNAIESSQRASNSGHKSPLTQNLATLAHAAYNHKPVNSSSAAAMALSSSTNSGNSAVNVAAAAARNYNNRESVGNNVPYHHLSAAASREEVRSCRGATNSGASRGHVALPRAEMKGCIEAYFNEEQQQHHQQQSPQTPHKSGSGSRERSSSARSGRMNGANPPLEGLAASLQDHVMASRKYKEEHEERQRRAAMAATGTNSELLHNHHQEAAVAHHYNNQQQQHHHHQPPHQSHTTASTPPAVKVEVGHKRTSPLANTNQPRPSKMPHYAHESMPQQKQQQQLHYTHGVVSSGTAAAHQMNNPYAHTNGGLHAAHAAHAALTRSTSSPSSRFSKQVPMEPLLMSPEINSIMGDERPLQLSSRQQPHQTHNTTPIVGGRAGDDDDVIADDETHWQHRVSSGFDRLVAFASTELDKTRRSIDTDTVPSSISCNTSPDSGITHSSSSNSDAARTFLSTSSTSSQLDLPIGSGSSGSSTSSSGYMHHHHHTNHASDHLSDSSLKSSHSDAASLPHTLKTSSPVDSTAIESPPLSDIGLPRTPSPNAAVATPPLAAAAIAAASASMRNATAATNSTTQVECASAGSGSALKIPLKYQRKSKSSSEKHYKKKFCERTWDYDCDELMAYSNSSSNTAADAAGTTTPTTNGPSTNKSEAAVAAASEKQDHPPSVKSGKSPKDASKEMVSNLNHSGNNNNDHHGSTTSVAGAATSSSSSNYHHHHKSSKFRPKGKDWDWSMESGGIAVAEMKGSKLDVNTTTTAAGTTTNVI